jgi:hypothetical protein
MYGLLHPFLSSRIHELTSIQLASKSSKGPQPTYHEERPPEFDKVDARDRHQSAATTIERRKENLLAVATDPAEHEASIENGQLDGRRKKCLRLRTN